MAADLGELQPAPFIFEPAAIEIAAQKFQKGAVPMGIGMVRLKVKCLLVAAHRPFQIELGEISVADVVVGIGKVGTDRQRLLVAADPLIDLALSDLGIAEIVPRPGMIGSESG